MTGRMVMLCAVFAQCALAATVHAAPDVAGLAPMGLVVERLTNPVGVQSLSPRLGWRLPTGMNAQSAYEIEANGVSSGRIEGDAQIDVPWPFPPLKTSQRVTWRVCVWDEKGGASEWSAPASFVAGVVDPADWKARWIGPNAATRPDIDLGGAKWISAQDGRYSTALVLDKKPEILEMIFFSRTRYQMFINGKKSGWSYTGHILDLRYPRIANLTPELRLGTNVVEIVAPNEGDAVPSALIAAFRENLARTFGETGAGWSPANVIGELREVEWGRDCVLREELASPAFRKRFSVSKDVAHATLFITGVGYCEASLNGTRVGDRVLDPSPTDYRKRVLYSTYVLDGRLRKGENELSVLLGHGLYDGRVRDEWNFDMAPWRDFPRMIAQLEIVYCDGSKETVVSDGSWRQVKSPVGWDDIHEGEVVGGSHGREPPFPPDGFPAAEVSGPGGILTCAAHPPTRILQELKPVAVHPVPDEAGAFLVEFPANVSGWARLRFRGLSRGDVVTVRYDERADGGIRPAADLAGGGVDAAKTVGGIETRRIDCHFKGSMSHAVCRVNSGFQVDRFISSGAPEETYEPRFTYNGFRYVYVRGLKSPLGAEDAVQCYVGTDFPETGTFSSSDAVLDRLVSAAAQSYRCNFTQGFPTDCPHREKNGWTDDASMASVFGMIRFDNDAAYAKWVQDIVDAQDSRGDLPGIVPTSGWGYLWGNGPMSDSALTVVPWNLYRYRADRATLEKAYPAIVRYLAYTETKADADGLVSHGLGDWNPVDWNVVPSVRFMASCFHMQATRIAGEMASVLGRAEESAAYRRRADEMRSAMRRVFMRPDGRFDDGRQTAQSCAIMFGLCEREELRAVGERLVEAVHASGDHTETGLVGSKTLYRALTKIGRADLALKVLLQPEAPSPAAWIAQGSDTLWEDYRDGLSRNHIMFGDFAAWAYEGLAGIRPVDPGYRSFEVDPAYRCGLSRISASVLSPYGRISVAWDKGRSLVVVVPPGTTAKVRLPDGHLEKLAPGSHSFRLSDSVSGSESCPYGACAHLTYGEPPRRTCAMMRQARMGWVRCDFDWHAMERNKGEWDFSPFDKAVSESAAEGLQLLPILGYGVPWAVPISSHLDDWAEYVRTVVTR